MRILSILVVLAPAITTLPMITFMVRIFLKRYFSFLTMNPGDTLNRNIQVDLYSQGHR